MTISTHERSSSIVRNGPLQLSISLDHSENETLQSQIFNQIRDIILNGHLKGKDPLPTTRELSIQLGVSRNTVILAYERLVSEGYICTKPNVGTFVSPDLPDATLLSLRHDQESLPNLSKPSPQIEENLDYFRTHQLAKPDRRHLAVDFWVGRPDPRSFPHKAWAQFVKNRLRNAGNQLTSYSDPAG